jgi:hypothetical protein
MENQAISNSIHSSTPDVAPLSAARGEAERYQNRPLMEWSGRVLSGLFALFILGASAAPKLLQLPVAEATMADLGWPPGFVFGIGILELSCVVLYLVPRTSVFGAVLTMGLLGGAMATQMRAQMPLFSHVLFSVYVGLFMWGGLWLRNPQLRALFPIFKSRTKPVDEA